MSKTTIKPEGVDIGYPEDEDAIYELMCEAYREQPIFPLDEGKMRDMIRHCLNRKGGVVALIRGPSGQLEGYLIAVMSQYWYTKGWHLEELSNFVHPEFRSAKGGRARRLVEFIKWFAEQLDMPLIMGILSTKRLDAKIKLYQRQVKPCGAVFVHNTGHLGDALSELG